MNVEEVSECLAVGLDHQRHGRLELAVAAYRSVLTVDPRHPRALHLLALIRASQGALGEAMQMLLGALESDPSDMAAVANLARVQVVLGELSLAMATARRGMNKKPGFASLHCIEASIYLRLGQPMDALAAYERARMIDPAFEEARQGVHASLQQLRLPLPENLATRGVEALQQTGFYLREGEAFYDAGVFGAAQMSFGVCLQYAPTNLQARSLLILSLMHACDWTHLDQELAKASAGLQESLPVPPFALLALVDDPLAHLKRTRNFFEPSLGSGYLRPSRLRTKGSPFDSRLKVAYVSADFHDHATSRLMVDMLEAHDRKRFQIVGVSLGPDEDSPMRQRIKQAFDMFIDARSLTDAAVAQQLVTLGVDIAVDVKGLTDGCREQIFLNHPAPIVVNFLAYPGSMGSSAYDYILGDGVVTPFSDAAYYQERIVQLPGTYQCNGMSRPEPASLIDRKQYGLPTEGVVFAAFNNTYKIRREVFSCWLRILCSVPDSVLWLTCEDASTKRNLLQFAASAGVDCKRLVFAPTLGWLEHLQRLQAADLFLDTWPYNAHTTASDALWMGLPVLTRMGRSFASRVAASLLVASGLPELVTDNESDYEAMAVRLASLPSELRVLRSRISSRRREGRLFDARRYAINLEQAYTFMVERLRQGLIPEAFEVIDHADGGGCRIPSDDSISPFSSLQH